MAKYYSEDPIMKYHTFDDAGKEGIRMPRVVCAVTCNNKTEKLSCTVSAKNKTSQFNLSDTLNGILSHSESYVEGSDGAPMIAHDYGHKFSCDFYHVYYTDAGEKTDGPKECESDIVVPGRHSDFRILKHGGSLDFLSLKQNMFGDEHVLNGFPYLISRRKGESDVFRYRDYGQLLYERNLCVIDYNPMMHHPIIFRNSFGELESALACCREKIDVPVQQDVYVTSRAIYDGHRTQFVSSHDDETKISLTTGAVTPMWAQWWTFEPLRSRRAWIWMPTDLTTAAGCWVPCILRADNNTILDRSKGASEINFTAVLDWQGGLL